MPELPEVETTCRGISPHLLGHNIDHIVVRQSKLRWAIPSSLQQAVDHCIVQVSRRGKYILLKTTNGCIIIHLGMSGVLKIIRGEDLEVNAHDHVDIIIKNGTYFKIS